MAKHHPDLIMCRKLPGIAIGRLCEKCACPPRRLPLARAPCRVAALTASVRVSGDGKCVICDSYVRPATLVRVCDECNYGSYAGRCVICGGNGISDAYYCKECTMQEKDVRTPRARCAGPAQRGSPNTHASRAAAATQRDGCPKIVNLGSAKTDLFYERKKCAPRSRAASQHCPCLATALRLPLSRPDARSPLPATADGFKKR